MSSHSQTWVKSLLYPALWYPIPPSEAIRQLALGASEVVFSRWTMGLPAGLNSSSTKPDILSDFKRNDSRFGYRFSFFRVLAFLLGSEKCYFATGPILIWFFFGKKTRCGRVFSLSRSRFPRFMFCYYFYLVFVIYYAQNNFFFLAIKLHTSKHYDASLTKLILF